MKKMLEDDPKKFLRGSKDPEHVKTIKYSLKYKIILKFIIN